MERRSGTSRPVALSSSSGTATTTLTIENSEPSSSSSQQGHQPEVLILSLNLKKKVSWKEGTVDNEFMQKKSSKKCCIFHKQKPFDEDDSDEDDAPHDPDKHPHDHSDSMYCCKNRDEASPSS